MKFYPKCTGCSKREVSFFGQLCVDCLAANVRSVVGLRNANGEVHVWYAGVPLDASESLALRNHSPTGFEWGYRGSGPSQLALAILLKVTVDREVSIDLYRQFCEDVVSHLSRRDFAVGLDYIQRWIEDQKRTRLCERVEA